MQEKEMGCIIITIVVHLQMQSEGYGAAICIFELQTRIASSSPLFLLLQCCEVLLFYRLVFIFVSPPGGCFLVSSGETGGFGERGGRCAHSQAGTL